MNPLTQFLGRQVLIFRPKLIGDYRSLESNEHRAGYFALALNEGLSGKADVNSDKVIYSNELDTYVSERVKSLSNGQQHPVTAKPGTIRSFPLAKQ